MERQQVIKPATIRDPSASKLDVAGDLRNASRSLREESWKAMPDGVAKRAAYLRQAYATGRVHDVRYLRPMSAEQRRLTAPEIAERREKGIEGGQSHAG